MFLKAVLALGLLPQLLSASVTCSYSVAASKSDTCKSISSTWGVSVDEFKSLNPGVECPNLVDGQSYCVLGSVSSEPTTSTTRKPQPTTTKEPPTKPDPTTLATTTASNPSPTQPGIADNCDKFYRVQSGDSCDKIENKFSISEKQFMEWNSSIKDDCSNLWLNYYVCVHVPGAAQSPAGPQPQMPGIVDKCKKFHKVESGDSCYSINQAAGISLKQFLAWNSEVDDGCTNLWKGYYVCVGV